MSSKSGKKGDSSPGALPSKQTTISICLGAAGLLTALMHVAGGVIRSSPPLIIGAGFLSAVVYLFLVIALGSYLDAPLGWTHILSTLVVAIVNAGLVHRICATTCFIFSTAVIGYLYVVSSSIYSRSN